jgi:hypothetical protein
MWSMSLAWGRSPDLQRALQQLVLAGLALVFIWTTVTGRAGVQRIDADLLARFMPVHRHGVAGEAAYIATHGSWYGLVHPHCHPQVPPPSGQPGPDEVHAATVLAGAVLCVISALPVTPTAGWLRPVSVTMLPFQQPATVPPLLRPPR